MSLKKGGLSAVLRKLEQVAGSDSFRVSTATAITGVRGTSFSIWADDNSTYVCACNGTVRTIDSKGNNELTIAAAHHSDASMESLASRIGEKIDWTKQE